MPEKRLLDVRARRPAGTAPGLVLRGRLDRAGVRRLLDASHLTALTSLGFDHQRFTVVESVCAGAACCTRMPVPGC